MILAHQYLDQLSGDLRKAALNTAGTLVSFRVSYRDARRLAKELFSSAEIMKNSKRWIRLGRFGNRPWISTGSEQIPLGWDGLAQNLTALPPRQFWLRRRGKYAPIRLRTLDMPDPKVTPETEKKLRKLVEISGEQFGVRKLLAVRELASRHGDPGFDHFQHDQEYSPGPMKGDVPLWGV